MVWAPATLTVDTARILPADLTEKLQIFFARHLGPHENKAVDDLTLKLENAIKLGIQQPFSEIVMITETTDIIS